MFKNQRTRTMVYSNVNKKNKADSKSASNDEIIDLDNEIVIGLAHIAEPEVEKNKNKKKNEKTKKIKDKENENTGTSSIQKKNNKKNNIQAKENNSNKKNEEKAASIKQKIKRQKRRAIKLIATIFLLIVLLIGGFIYFLLSPVFNVKNIEVIDNQGISTELIVNISGIHLNENMFKVSKKQVKKAILANPYIEDVKISRKLFNTMKIQVKEREATLMLDYGNSYVYINNQGYILEISPVKLQAPIITGYVTPLEEIKPGNRLGKDDLERLTTVLNIIEAAESNGIADLITKIDVQSKKDYILTLETEDKIVYLGECSELSTQMLFIKEMISREKGIEGEFFIDMDLNTGNPVFREKV